MQYEKLQKMVGIPCSLDFYQQVRVAAALRGQSIASFGRTLLEQAISESSKGEKQEVQRGKRQTV